ncbi:MAG: WbqC family protein [Candidatus Omnitrophica bacterium]|nr:WbqC family protein [Candidatus Omnitrophota bacterium]
MILSLHQPHYLPWLGYFHKIAASDCFVFLDCVQYKPREFQNRNKIRTENSWIWLTVPVQAKHKGRQPIREVMIDNELPWMRQHAKSLQTWYARAPYFKEYFPFFEDVYRKTWERLEDLNVCIIRYILKQLSIETPIHFESDCNILGAKTDRIIELCKKMDADTYLSGAGGRQYLEEDKFADAGITLKYQEFIHPKYCQQFLARTEDFIPFLAAIDLLFNEGYKSKEILCNSSK